MSREVAKGTSFETQVVRYLRDELGDPIERRAKCGTADRGDVAGVYMHGRRMVVECKNCRRMELPKWLSEAETERVNDGADYAVVVHKRRGFGERNMGGTYVTLSLWQLARIIKDVRQ